MGGKCVAEYTYVRYFEFLYYNNRIVLCNIFYLRAQRVVSWAEIIFELGQLCLDYDIVIVSRSDTKYVYVCVYTYLLIAI